MFDGYIMDLASGDEPTSIDTIDAVLSHQEDVLREMQLTADYAMVNLSRN